MSIESYWQQYLASNNLAPTTSYTDAWAFGDNPAMADELLELVRSGKKTTTTGLLAEHEYHNWHLPEVGDKIIILDGRGTSGCIIEVVQVRTVSFSEMDDLQFAIDEGEGFDTIDKWRQVHRRYFSRVMQVIGKEFDEDMLIICETFACIYQ